MRVMSLLVSVLLLTLWSVPTQAQDPGQTSGAGVAMFRGDAGRTGVMPGPGPDPDQGLGVRWRFDADADFGSSPAVVDGTLYIGSREGTLFALNAATGNERWRFKTPDETSLGASPAVADGLVYIGSSAKEADSNPGGFYVLDAASGEQRWEVITGGDFLSSPAFADGVVFVGEVSTSDSLEGQPGLHAFDASSGDPLWHVRETSGVISSPAVSDGVVYAGTIGGELIAVDAASGDVLWRFTAKSELHASPAVADGTVYITSIDGNLFAIDAVSGAERWRFETESEVGASPAAAHGRMYIVTSSGTLLALDGAKGEIVWELALGEAGDDVVSSPAVIGELLYIGSADGRVLAINAQSGEERAAYDLGGWTESSPTIVDGVVYIGQEAGSVYALEDAVMDLEPSQWVVTDKATSLFAGPSADADVVETLDELTLVEISQGLDFDGERWWGVTLVGTDLVGFIRATDLKVLPAASEPEEAPAGVTVFKQGDLGMTNKQAGLYPSPSPAAHMFDLLEPGTLVELQASAVDVDNQIWWSVSVVDSTRMGWIREADLEKVSPANQPNSTGSQEEDGPPGVSDCPPESGGVKLACPPVSPLTPEPD